MSSPQDPGADEAQEIVTDVFVPDGERQEDDASLSPEVASAAAAEIEAAELGDAATASRQYEGGDAAPDPE